MKPIRIFYLDDEQALCENFQDLFSDPETQVETFVDHNAMIQRLENYTPDLIFLDFRLRGISGEDVAKALHPDILKVLITGDIRVKVDFPFLKILEKPTKESEILGLLSDVRKKL